MSPSDLITLDPRDVFYTVAGLGFLLLTILPAIRHGFAAAPVIYVVAGALLALSPLALPVLDPMGSELEIKVIEHASELIVIISLAGAGLAIDRPVGWRSWAPAWRLLLVTMPLTVAAIAWGAVALAGLPLAAALLLGASLAPTDPVLARSVQVGAPTEGGEDDVRLGLTAEAGLNDGLAFPFVYLAIAVAGLPALAMPGWDSVWSQDWLHEWAAFDLLYRVAVGVLVGIGAGTALAWIIHEIGDGSGEGADRGENAGLTVLAATFIAYGLAEAVSGYGFLAVFVAARAGRRFSARDRELTEYNRHPHLFSVQFESILLALLLLWFGGLVATGLLEGLTMAEAMLAVIVLFVVRPLAGWAALVGYRARGLEKLALAFFGIRGMGTVFYVAYGQTHADFDSMEAVWRIAGLAILLSIVVHSVAAAIVMRRIKAGGADDPGTDGTEAAGLDAARAPRA